MGYLLGPRKLAILFTVNQPHSVICRMEEFNLCTLPTGTKTVINNRCIHFNSRKKLTFVLYIYKVQGTHNFIKYCSTCLNRYTEHIATVCASPYYAHSRR